MSVRRRFSVVFLSFLITFITLSSAIQDLILQSTHVKVILPFSTLTSGYFDVLYDDKAWYHSQDIFVRHQQHEYSTLDQSLYVQSPESVHIEHHADSLGKYEEVVLPFSSKNQPKEVLMLAKIRLYADDFIVFEQFFPHQLTQTASPSGADDIITSFPSFVIAKDDEGVGFAQWISWFYENLNTTSTATATRIVDQHHRKTLVAPGFTSPQLAEWNDNTVLLGGVGGSGVNLVFDETGRNTATMSAFSNPMVISHISPEVGTLKYGIMGNVTNIPAQYSIQMLLSFHNEGINEGIVKWGQILRQKYQKLDANHARSKDITLQYLGYTTDNGAYYYYHTEDNKTYEDTILDLYQYAKKESIPYKYILLDSWWYYKGSNGGVSDWSAQPELFPKGLSYLFEQTSWYVQAHNRYWALDNVYSKDQHGKYNFISDYVKNGSVPMDPRFWKKALLSIPSKEWGLKVYEQDWLFNEFFQYVSAMLEDVHVAKLWLTQMASGAKENNLTIQYCMPFIRHLLQSVEFDVVTQARASDDYVVSSY